MTSGVGPAITVRTAVPADLPELRRVFRAASLADAVEGLRESGRHRLWVVGNRDALAFYRALGFSGGEPVVTDLGAGLRLHLDL